jgi:hypothetical protein
MIAKGGGQSNHCCWRLQLPLEKSFWISSLSPWLTPSQPRMLHQWFSHFSCYGSFYQRSTPIVAKFHQNLHFGIFINTFPCLKAFVYVLLASDAPKRVHVPFLTVIMQGAVAAFPDPNLISIISMTICLSEVKVSWASLTGQRLRRFILSANVLVFKYLWASCSLTKEFNQWVKMYTFSYPDTNKYINNIKHQSYKTIKLPNILRSTCTWRNQSRS